MAAEGLLTQVAFWLVGQASRLPPRASRPREFSLARRPLGQPGRLLHYNKCAPFCFVPSGRTATLRSMPLMKHARALLTSAAVLSFISIFGYAAAADKTLDIYWVDVEGGGATLIVTPAGESVLIDSGNPGVRDSSRIHRTAQGAGLKKIDHYVTTHFHTDHFGGAAELSALMPIGQVHDNGIPESNPDGNRQDTRWPLVSKPYREFKADGRNVLTAAEQIKLKQAEGSPKLTLRCVAAKQKFIESPGTPPKNTPCDQAVTKDKDT